MQLQTGNSTKAFRKLVNGILKTTANKTTKKKYGLNFVLITSPGAHSAFVFFIFFFSNSLIFFHARHLQGGLPTVSASSLESSDRRSYINYTSINESRLFSRIN